VAPAEREDLVVTTPSDREIVMTRGFGAPRRLVFDALTKPELLKRWLGRPDWSLAVCEIDLRVGGALRYVWREPDGGELGLRGVYREIVRPERIVHTETFDPPWSSGETLVTTVLTEQGGRTTLTTTVLYESRAARDGAIRSRMTEGAAVSYQRLDELLAATA
jgi:uncharacterized protein YndB with AHSA1/START domain